MLQREQVVSICILYLLSLYLDGILFVMKVHKMNACLGMIVLDHTTFAQATFGFLPRSH